MPKISGFGLIAAMLCLCATGCDDATQKKAESAVADKSQQVGKQVGDQVSKQVDQQIKQGTDKVQAAAASDLESGKVMAALKGASGLEAKDISVETDSSAKTISLSGFVPTQDEADQALMIVKGMAGKEFKVDDHLKVKAG